jgi:F-box protein 21
MPATNICLNNDVLWIPRCLSTISPRSAPKSVSSCMNKVLGPLNVRAGWLTQAHPTECLSTATRFYDISNHFPHVYLTTNKLSIPISLVHVFVSIARHPSIGVPASPVEFPTRVLVHVASPPGADDFLVDVYGARTKPIVSLRNDIPVMLMRLGIPPDNLSQYVSPCGAAPMLLRAARNILSSFRNDATRSTAQSAIYAAVCIHLLLTNETQLVAHMLSHVDLDPLYCATFLSDLQPFLRHGCQHLLERACQQALAAEQALALLVHRRTVQAQITHYVGMVFEHRSYHYVGCIIGWEVPAVGFLQHMYS